MCHILQSTQLKPLLALMSFTSVIPALRLLMEVHRECHIVMQKRQSGPISLRSAEVRKCASFFVALSLGLLQYSKS